jgi:hypothetical protein
MRLANAIGVLVQSMTESPRMLIDHAFRDQLEAQPKLDTLDNRSRYECTHGGDEVRGSEEKGTACNKKSGRSDLSMAQRLGNCYGADRVHRLYCYGYIEVQHGQYVVQSSTGQCCTEVNAPFGCNVRREGQECTEIAESTAKLFYAAAKMRKPLISSC